MKQDTNFLFSSWYASVGIFDAYKRAWPPRWPRECSVRNWYSLDWRVYLQGIAGYAMNRDKQIGIQVARAVAALSIVYYHSWTSIVRFPKGTAHQIPGLTTYGWFAVYLFFAISGYVICLVVSRETFQVPSFLIKRVFRLYPLWLVMMTTFAVTAWLWRGLQPFETLDYFLYSATLLPTFDYPFYNVGWSDRWPLVWRSLCCWGISAKT